MAVLSNTMMQGTAAISDDAGDYQIPKSLKFKEADSTNLTLFTSAGNRRAWTWAAWIKRWDVDNRSTLFSAGDSQSDDGWTAIEIETDEKLKVTGWNTTWKQTSRLFRDPAAWTHIVISFDTMHNANSDRCRMYVNGKRQTSFSAENAPTQNTDYAVNKGGVPHRIGGIDPAGVNNGLNNFYLADNYLIDGVQLSPACFGFFDSTGVWQAKAFAPPTPNTDAGSPTWSGDLVHLVEGFNSNNPATKPFSGYSSNNGPYTSTMAGGPNNTGGYFSGETKAIEFTPTNPIPFNCSIEVRGRNTNQTTSRARLDFGDGYGSIIEIPNGYWNTIHEGKGSLKKLKFWTITYAGENEIGGIKIDGVDLVDGRVDRTPLTNPNLGHKWSDLVTLTNTTRAVTNLFDGVVANSAAGVIQDNASNTAKITFNTTIKCGLVEVWSDSGTNVIGINTETPDQTVSFAGWHTIYDGAETTLSKITWKMGGSDIGRIDAIKVDGHQLVDGRADNSFHLTFNDVTTENRSIGYSQVMNTCTGGQPMYGPGADDSAKSSLVLALPGYNLLDHAPDIKGSGSAKTIDAVANATTSTNRVKFYDKSIYLDGTGDYLKTADSSSDFSFGTGDFTIECWAYWTGSGEDGVFQLSTNTNGYNPGNTNTVSLRVDGGQWVSYANDGNRTFSSAAVANQWYHLALVRVSGTLKLYVNGVVDSTTFSDTRDYSMTYCAIGANSSASYVWAGNIQDFRVYKGTAKYTASFTPPTRNDFIPSNFKGSSNLWSKYAVSSTGAYWTSSGDFTAHNGFDGSPTSGNYVEAGATSGSGATITWTPPGGMSYKTSVEAMPRTGTSVKLNGGSAVAGSTDSWQSLATGSGTITTLLFERTSNSDGAQFQGIRVDGEILVDNQDVCTDSPTNSGEDTGNFCTLNRFQYGGSVNAPTNGNLSITSASSGYGGILGTMGMSSGKWYWEWAPTSASSAVGIALPEVTLTSYLGQRAEAWIYLSNGNKANNNSYSSIGTTYTHGDIIGIAFDATAGNLYFYKNGTITNSGSAFYTGLTSGPYLPAFSDDFGSAEGNGTFNFGATPFANTVPTGYKALCTTNLDDTFSGDEVNDPSKYFDAITYTGNGSGDDGTSQAIKGAKFQPDLVWLKSSNNAWWHHMFDAVRGAGKSISPNSQNAEQTLADNQFTSFNSDGFTVVQKNAAELNEGSQSYISWLWDAGTAAATASTDGSITPTGQWVNATAGFSITQYNGTQANATVGHGLNTAPGFMIHKMYDDGSTDWQAWHSGINGTQGMQLSTNGAVFTQADMWNNTAPTNTVFHLGAGTGTNKSGEPIMMYIWAPVPGYSHFGNYSGGDDPTFVYTGMKPKFIIIKCKSHSDSWLLYDAARDKYNVIEDFLQANNSEAEATGNSNKIDILSNGFNVYGAQNGTAGSGRTYIYCAWAEHPFKTARAK